jgi:hypothetical protein
MLKRWQLSLQHSTAPSLRTVAAVCCCCCCLQAIKDVDEFRRMQGSLLLHSSDTVSMNLALNSIAPTHTTLTSTGQASRASGAADLAPPLATFRLARMPHAVSSSSGAVSADAAAAAAAAAAGTGIHTELLEACGVAVLQLYVVPGQAVVSGGMLASALDDVAAAVAAVCHDEGLQLVRWGARRWLLLAQLEPGATAMRRNRVAGLTFLTL